METIFESEIDGLTLEIEKIAPNMKAIDKLNEVEEKLKGSAEEFDSSRKQAKSAKDKFLAIRQERYVTWSFLFRHDSLESLINPLLDQILSLDHPRQT